MGKFSIRQTVKHDIVPLSASFQFNYGRATVRLDPNGTYTLSANGSTYSEYVNSARRAYQYKPTVQQLSEKMRYAYEQQTADYTQLNYNLSPAKTYLAVQNTLDKLVLKKYRNKPFGVKKPTDVDIRHELEMEASQIYFKTFGKDKKHIQEYIDEHIQEALKQRLDSWTELQNYHDRIQSQNAESQNLIYLQEYTEKKEELENILSGPSRFVDSDIRKRVADVRLPFDIELEYSYSKTNKTLDIEVEVPLNIPIPFQKASILSSGKISIKTKTAKDVKTEQIQCVFGLAFYLASKFFDVTVNIEKLSVTIWEAGKNKGLLWVEFPRDQFNDFIKRNRQFDPVYYITIGEYYSVMTSTRASSSVNALKSSFLKKIDEIKNGPEVSSITRGSASSQKSSSTSSWSQQSLFDTGDLNPAPLHLTISEAHILAKHVNDPTLEEDISNAMWAGERTVAVSRKYQAIWEKLKKETWKS